MSKWMTLMCVALLGAVVLAQESDNANKHTAAREVSADAYKANQQKYKDNADVMVRPGLLADRKAKTVKLWSVALTLQPSDPVEFLVVPDGSAKDYESLAMTFAKLSDVNEALQFIGVKPGHAIDFADFIFQPRGPDIKMTIGWTDAQGKQHAKPIQELLYNPQTDQNWNQRLVYTGSRWVSPPDGKKMWLADESDAAALASTFSNPASVLDVADRCGQGDVYGTAKPLDDMPFGGETPLIITLSPTGKFPAMDAMLTVKLVDGKMRVDMAATEADKPLTPQEAITWVRVLDQLSKWTHEGKVPFVTVNWSDDLPVGEAVKAAALLGKLEQLMGVRVDAPAKGQLFYRAYLPNPEWSDPAKRMFNGWDVTLPTEGGKDKQSIVAIERSDVRDPKTGHYNTVAKSHDLADPEALAKLLQQQDGDKPRDVYLHVPPSITCGRLQAALAPSLPHHPTVYIFID